MSQSLFHKMSAYDSPATVQQEKNKYKHDWTKTVGILFAFLSYLISFAFVAFNLYDNNKIFHRSLLTFHEKTKPLSPPFNWIGPLWMVVYGAQLPWLIYALTTICRRSENDYLYQYPRPIHPIQSLTFTAGCWANTLFVFLINHNSLSLALVYTVLGAMTIAFCLVTSIIHLHNYERELSISELFGDIWCLRLLVHNGLSLMLFWEILLMCFTIMYTLTLNFPSVPHEHIAIWIIIVLSIISLVYLILFSCLFFNPMCHIVSGWILLLTLTVGFWHNQPVASDHTQILDICFYSSSLIYMLIICLHLMTTFLRYSGKTWRSLFRKSQCRHSALLNAID